ncbi:hypothetical protein, partial [Mycobacterium kubicae]|uniref:hypothetical protein n=1 Tax=Mycobacterium kubicae TaxID=120959 RepID=UPI0021F2CECC
MLTIPESRRNGTTKVQSFCATGVPRGISGGERAADAVIRRINAHTTPSAHTITRESRGDASKMLAELLFRDRCQRSIASLSTLLRQIDSYTDNFPGHVLHGQLIAHSCQWAESWRIQGLLATVAVDALDSSRSSILAGLSQSNRFRGRLLSSAA